MEVAASEGTPSMERPNQRKRQHHTTQDRHIEEEEKEKEGAALAPVR